PVLSFGFSHSRERIIVTENAVVISDLTADKPQSYSAGLEIGTKLGGFRLGTEAGYMGYQCEDLAGYEGSIKAVDRLDMSGPYVIAIIGFGIYHLPFNHTYTQNGTFSSKTAKLYWGFC